MAKTASNYLLILLGLFSLGIIAHDYMENAQLENQTAQCRNAVRNALSSAEDLRVRLATTREKMEHSRGVVDEKITAMARKAAESQRLMETLTKLEEDQVQLKADTGDIDIARREKFKRNERAKYWMNKRMLSTMQEIDETKVLLAAIEKYSERQ